MEIIEKCARAICERMQENPDCVACHFDNKIVKLWETYVEDVRTVLQAMREPSEEMLHFGEGYCDFIMPDGFDNSRGGRMQELKLGYQVMMDVANGKHPDKRSSAPGKSGMGEG